MELLDDESGLQWNGGEKTYDMDQIVALVIRLMQQKYPEFGLTGKLLAQGEDIEDRWQLYYADEYLLPVDVELIKGEIIDMGKIGRDKYLLSSMLFFYPEKIGGDK